MEVTRRARGGSPPERREGTSAGTKTMTVWHEKYQNAIHGRVQCEIPWVLGPGVKDSSIYL